MHISLKAKGWERRAKAEKAFLFQTRRHYQCYVEAVVEATMFSIDPLRDDKMTSACVPPVWK